MKSPTEREVDEHGFPVPVTFDGPSAQRGGRACCGRRAWLWGLALVFLVLLVGAVKNSSLPEFGKQIMAAKLMDRAQEKYRESENINDALADLDRALSWTPEDPQIFELRGQFRREAGDLEGSLADYNQLIKLQPRFAGGYLGRSVTLQRLNRHREAIDDLSLAVELRPTGDPLPLNNRAYARALANIELDAAMVDVQLALERAPEDSESYAAYLDTRGYLHFLRGDSEESLVDLNAAISKMQHYKREIQEICDRQRIGPRSRARVMEQVDHGLAVMHHHRGLAHEKLGHAKEAAADFGLAQTLGYNPAAGVY